METGELFVLPTGRGSGTPLAVPAVYIAYMATFGAMVSFIRRVSFYDFLFVF